MELALMIQHETKNSHPKSNGARIFRAPWPVPPPPSFSLPDLRPSPPSLSLALYLSSSNLYGPRLSRGPPLSQSLSKSSSLPFPPSHSPSPQPSPLLTSLVFPDKTPTLVKASCPPTLPPHLGKQLKKNAPPCQPSHFKSKTCISHGPLLLPRCPVILSPHVARPFSLYTMRTIVFLPPGTVGCTSTWHIVAPQSVIATVVIISGLQSRGPLVTWSPRRPTQQSFILFPLLGSHRFFAVLDHPPGEWRGHSTGQ